MVLEAALFNRQSSFSNRHWQSSIINRQFRDTPSQRGV